MARLGIAAEVADERQVDDRRRALGPEDVLELALADVDACGRDGPGGWPSQYVRSTPTRSNVLASRRAIRRPWPPAMPVMRTVSPASRRRADGSRSRSRRGAARADGVGRAEVERGSSGDCRAWLAPWPRLTVMPVTARAAQGVARSSDAQDRRVRLVGPAASVRLGSRSGAITDRRGGRTARLVVRYGRTGVTTDGGRAAGAVRFEQRRLATAERTRGRRGGAG